MEIKPTKIKPKAVLVKLSMDPDKKIILSDIFWLFIPNFMFDII